jgi:hypothetical protein
MLLLITLSSCGSQQVSTQVSSDAWREDLRYLARELPNQHANAFHTVSRETFAGEVARLDAGIPSMNGDEVLVGFMRVVALIGDGHTHLDLPLSSPRYPVELQLTAGKQAFRVQALACVVGQRQPKGWTLNACVGQLQFYSAPSALGNIEDSTWADAQAFTFRVFGAGKLGVDTTTSVSVLCWS